VSAGNLITGPGQLQWRNLLLGPGTDYDLKDLSGWEDMPPVDVGSKTKPRGHGADPGRMLAQPHTFTSVFDVNPQASGGTGPARAFILAQTGLPDDTRQEPIAVCLDQGVTMLRFGQLTARKIPFVVNYENVIENCALQWECADPRLYSSAQTVISAALPVAAPASQAVRTNATLNPLAITPGTGFGAYAAGTGEAGTTTWITGAGDGPMPEITTYGRWSVTTAKTSGSTGWKSEAAANRAPASGVAGDVWTGSIWLRYTGTGTAHFVPRISFYTSGGTQLTPVDATPVDLVSGQWTRITASAAAPGTFASVALWPYQTSGYVLPAGSTLDATGEQVEFAAQAGTFVSGATPNTPNLVHAWTGAANASASTETLSSPGVFPLTYPAPYATMVAGGGPQTAVNNGNATSPPVYTIAGGASGVTSPAISITDGTGTRQTVFNLTLAAGDALVIDVLNRTVLLNGANRYGFSTGTPIESLTLAPGSSTLSLSGTGDGSVLLTAAFYDAYI
jgi:hypothetical protein